MTSIIEIPNIRDIRLATKGLVGLPQHFLQDDVLKALERIAKKAREHDVDIAVHTHVNHANQVTPLVRQAAEMVLDASVLPADIQAAVAEPPQPTGLPPDLQGAADPLDRLTYHPTAATGLFRIALQAGLLGVIANIIPLGLGMVLTGILAALLYHRAAGQTLSSAKAARLGAMSGASVSSTRP